MPTRRKMAAGNWKMNGLAEALSELDTLDATLPRPRCDVLLCPPATLLSSMAALAKGTAIKLGGQDCHWQEKGAHTGDISAEMLADAGAVAVIVGHSERRADHGEDDATVRAKAEAAHRAGLTAIICVGETGDDRDAGRTLDVVGAQLDGSIPDNADAAGTIIAYEPVWAIGTGRTPTLGDIEEVHRFIRARLTDRFGDAFGDAVRLLYGGSVKAGNAAEIFEIADVDGGLVGGASLKASDFKGIVDAASRLS
ncbi:triose-phosphate isomerase [Oceanomicrobium pacificus]|uniref:Triosephosphate isomerase n=1 Tax=Oceanomicrobium pacificus TaxID=2692916 RepID=A0A6B0TXK2_9RHOB|nr:triose-phosphate isomerase [Oceanomicrobium pacificus]MXU66198.1 triose-phosphate isomerase [Oceanomicrobium pacificus]